MSNVQIDTTATAELDILHAKVSSQDLLEVAERLLINPLSGSMVFSKDQQNFRAITHKGLRYIYYLSQDDDRTVLTILSVVDEAEGRDRRLQKLFSNLAKTVGALGSKSAN